jgi:hypothetical protein
MQSLEHRLAGFASSEAPRVPLPGAGNTPEGHQALCRWGATDLSFARIAEAHVDALSILSECSHHPRSGALYGVWASDAPPSRVTCEQLAGGEWRIEASSNFAAAQRLSMQRW